MTNLTIIENKVSAVKKYLKTLERYQKHTKRELEGSVDIKGAVERYLYLVAQATIDLAEAVIAYKKFRKPPKRCRLNSPHRQPRIFSS